MRRGRGARRRLPSGLIPRRWRRCAARRYWRGVFAAAGAGFSSAGRSNASGALRASRSAAGAAINRTVYVGGSFRCLADGAENNSTPTSAMYERRPGHADPHGPGLRPRLDHRRCASGSATSPTSFTPAAPDHRQHLHHSGIGNAAVGSQIHPGRPFGSHEGGEGGAKILVGEGRLIEVDLPALVDGDDETRFRVERTGLGARQADVHAPLHDRRGDHENDQEHEGDVHQRRHVDVGVERELTVPAQPAATQEAGHLEPPLARHRPDDFLRKSFQLAGEQTEPADQDVVRHHRRARRRRAP